MTLAELSVTYICYPKLVADYAGVLGTLTETGVPLIEARGTDTEWTFEGRGDERSDIAEFQRCCRERGIPITLTALHALTSVETATEAALTDEQLEALVLAYERGYFNSPREVKMKELCSKLGISQQAVASWLRRGTRRILGNTLTALEA
nr:helix-turn-helix domain-containing protein [Haloprofundus halobius]